jgi:two-component system sensor histidine kinase SenX3
MSLSSAGVAAVAAAVLLGLIVLIARLRARRGLTRRLVALTARMGEADLELDGRGGVEARIGQLERMVDATVSAASEARTSQSLMQEALAYVPQAVVIGNENGVVVYQNGPAQRLLDEESGEVEARDVVAKLLKSAAEGRAEATGLDLLGPPRRRLTVQGRPLHDEVRTLGGVVIVDDHSERRRLDAVRRDFVDNIGNELKRPVGSLGLLAETLAAEEDPEVVARLSRRLQNEAQRVSRVIDDLLHLSRIEAEEEPTREPVPVHLVVAQAAERVRAAAQEKEMTINFGEPAQRLSVVGDRRQLVSAVYNLLDNAVKYSPLGSTVEVRGRQDGEWVELSVRDRGIGIPERDLERIFERFYRVERARSRQLGGTGLGLAMVRHVVGNHNGEVRVESQEGQGSTFTLRLPASPASLVGRAKAG